MSKKANTTTILKKELNLLDRVMIGTVLPKESSYLELVISKDITDRVRITQEEMKKYNLRTVGSGLTWDNKWDDATFPFTFNQIECDTVRKGLKKMDEEKKLLIEHLHLFELFAK